METNAKRFQKIPRWQLEITVEELSTSIEATIQQLDLTSEVTEDEYHELRNLYINKYILISINISLYQ